jgi:hypothetical protein
VVIQSLVKKIVVKYYEDKLEHKVLIDYNLDKYNIFKINTTLKINAFTHKIIGHTLLIQQSETETSIKISTRLGGKLRLK